jgi:hypothetical protein
LVAPRGATIDVEIGGFVLVAFNGGDRWQRFFRVDEIVVFWISAVHRGSQAPLFFLIEREDFRVGGGAPGAGDDVEGVIDDVVVACGGADCGFGDEFCEVGCRVFDWRVVFGLGFAVGLRVCDGGGRGFGRVGVVGGEEGKRDGGEG